MKKLVISLVAVVIVLSMAVACLAGCNGENGDEAGKFDITITDLRVPFESKVAAGGASNAITVTLDNTLVDEIDHTGDDFYATYDSVLGDYYTAMVATQAQEDADAKFVGYAIAEAKLLENAVYLPTTSKGGAYSISRMAPGTVSPIGWGMDQERYQYALLASTPIKAADREVMKTKYAELKGTGTYKAWAISYLNEKGYSYQSTYTKGYSSDPKTWDITNTYRAADSEAIINTFDNLIEYDNEGRIMGALATDLVISEDGLKYTFTIREGVSWVDKDGRERYEVTADDWVYGMQRILTNKQTSYLVTGVIKNAAEYAAGTITDFSQVGVKATGKYTLEYTLEEPCSYFITMFNYNPFAPVCREYAESTEGYGTEYDKILSCGPYIVTNYTKDNKIVFSANEKYWNKGAVTVKSIEWKSYKDNKDVTATYNDMKAGIIDGAALNATTIELAKSQNMWDVVYVSGTDSTAYGFFYNVNREAYETIEGYGMASTKTADQKARSKKAMLNNNFRMAIARGIDRAGYNAQDVGDDCKLYSLQNMYTPGSFVQLSKAVTVAINGQNQTFAKGTYYGEIVQAQINADMGEKAIKVWDPTKENGLGSSGGFDGWYNATVANQYLNAAITELAAQGVEISAQNPIYIDYPYWDYETYANRAQALKQQIERDLGGKVILNLVSTTDVYGWYFAGYYCESGDEGNYDLYDCSGWGPDYGDPVTYLNTMMPVVGDMIKMTGLY